MPFPMLEVFQSEIGVLRAQEGLHAVHVANLGGGNMKAKDYQQGIKVMSQAAGFVADEEKVKREVLKEDEAGKILSWLGEEADDKTVAEFVKADKKRFGKL